MAMQILIVRSSLKSRTCLQKPLSSVKFRNLCSLNRSNTMPAPKNEREELLAVYPNLVKDARKYIEEFDNKTENDWMQKVFDYNLPHGKLIRGSSAVRACKEFYGESQWTPENKQKACYLGWCIEMLHTAFLIIDDITDGGETRRGKPCWYRVEDVGSTAYLDALIMMHIKDHILEKRCRDKDNYTKLLKIFQQVDIGTIVGQNIDVKMQRSNVTQFSMDIYERLVIKTTYLLYYLPFISAFILANKNTEDTFLRQVEPILLQAGYFFQMQDDFLDCFGNPAKIHKIGTDIQENKCSWLAVKCMELASQKQKDIMMECYGQKDPKKVERIKELYIELDLPNVFSHDEQKLYEEMNSAINEIQSVVFRKIISENLNELYRREA